MSVAVEQVLSFWASAMWRASWQGGLVVFAVWLACWLMPRIPARHQCWLWRLTVVKFVFVLAVPFVLHVPLLPAHRSESAGDIALIQPSEPILATEPNLHNPSVLSTKTTLVEFPALIIISFITWMIGMTWHLVRLQRDRREALRIRRECRPLHDHVVHERLTEQRELLGVSTTPDLLVTTGQGSPMVVGINRPSIVLPDETLNRLNHSELDMVLAHELAHIRRRELSWSLLASVVRALFFFHPLVWLIERRLHAADEIATDELTVTCQHCDPISCGSLLVSITSKIVPHQSTLRSSLGATGTFDSLRKRLSAMVLFGQHSRPAIIKSSMVVGAIFLIGMIPWKLVAAQPGDGKEAAPVIRLSDIEAFFLVQAVQDDENSSLSSTRITCEQGRSVGVTPTGIPEARSFQLTFNSKVAQDKRFVELSIDARDSLFSNYGKSTLHVPSGGTVVLIGKNKAGKTGLALVQPELKASKQNGVGQVSMRVYFCDVGKPVFDKIGFDFDGQHAVEQLSGPECP